MDNASLARVSSDIGDLLEIKGANPFKIRAYRNAADIIDHTAERVAHLTEADVRGIPGIGKDLAAKIRELVDTGELIYFDALRQEFPASILDMLRLQGVGPKTVGLLYAELGIETLEELEAAASDGRLRQLKGMGAKKEQLLLRSLAEHRSHVGRHLVGRTDAIATRLTEYLRMEAPEATIFPVGSLRRGRETCGDIDLLAVNATDALMPHFTRFPDVERILGQGPTKSSALLRGGVQVDLRVAAAESAGAAAQYFTGSKAHNIAVRDIALQRGLKLNEYGLFRVADGEYVAGAAESDVYEARGLAYVPPELREHRGEIAAAATRSLPHLVERSDLRGDLHSHTTATDGKTDVETMATAARDAGLEYLAITDHSQALAMANGLDERRALAHATHIREVNARLEGITLLAGIECDIRADGTLDLADDCLAELDLVVASVHSAFGQGAQQMTDRLLRAIDSPFVDIIGHPTGRLLLRRDPYALNLEQVLDAAARCGVAMEINSQIHRLDLSDSHARLARDREVKLVISTDAHAPAAFELLRWGVTVARRAWLEPGDVLNTLGAEDLRASLRRHRVTG
ncbi:MAG: DNA polymerase/3'-5' exonuclease PolX [Vicinamibacterales bacterium]|nr:DNA polymerase/3'-5' exonuclease PolX [Vicinamibacterales bacterium]